MVEILDATSRYQHVEVISALLEIIPDQPAARHHRPPSPEDAWRNAATDLERPGLLLQPLHLKPELVTEMQNYVLEEGAQLWHVGPAHCGGVPPLLLYQRRLLHADAGPQGQP